MTVEHPFDGSFTQCRCRLVSAGAAAVLVFERRHALENSKPKHFTGTTAAQPLLPVPGEVFALRKLLPQTADYDFNVHVMDFQPGEYLYVKVGNTATCLLEGLLMLIC